MKKLANKLKEIRKQNDLTQEELARSLGYANKSMINHIEKGDKNMSYEKLLLLIKKYNVDVNCLDNEEADRIDRLIEDTKLPSPDTLFPIENYYKEINVKPSIRNKNIVVGDFTYIADSHFENHVTHLYPWNNDKLIIGKFCQIASGVEFIMNGANHQMNAVTTFPFFAMDKWNAKKPDNNLMPLKGDTVIGNDVWIGQNAVIMPGVRIGDGAIIGCNSVVSKSVDPYTIVAGNPIRIIRKRFDNELINLLEKLKWWDKPVKEIMNLIPILTNPNLNEVKKEIKKLIKK